MILAPAVMASEPDPKTSAAKCLQEIQLDPESYRIGHTKASLEKNKIKQKKPYRYFQTLYFIFDLNTFECRTLVYYPCYNFGMQHDLYLTYTFFPKS